MNKISINVLKDVTKCKNCGNPKAFFYLSDFSYGQKLIFLNNATEYAFINLIEDKYYLEYANIVKKILSEENMEVTEEVVNNFINQTYGITCDLINGYKVDFLETQKKCAICNSTEFERNMIEPESIVQIDAYTISHDFWENLGQDEREEVVKNELVSRKVI